MKNSKLNLGRKNLFLVFFLIIALIPYLYASFYTNPIADDFTYAFKGKNNPLASTLINEYLNWNGRYISNIFVLLNPISFKCFLGYKLIPIILILLTVSSNYFFIKKLTNRKVENLKSVIYALFLTILYLYQMPIVSEGIYWYTGAVTYQLGNIFLLYYFGFLAQFFYEKYLFQSKIIHVIILFLFVIITIGFNEILMISLILIHLGLCFIYFTNNLFFKKLVFYLLITSIIFGCIVFFAPGNKTRESFFPNNHMLLSSLSSTFAQIIRFSTEWISSAPLIFVSIIYFEINKILSEQLTMFNKSFYLKPYMSIFLLFIAIFIGVFPPYWSTGLLGQHRTLNTSYFLFILVWFINLTVLYNHKLISFEPFNSKVKVAFSIIIWLSFIFNKNGYSLIQDIRNDDIRKYNDQMIKRYSLIQSKNDTIYFEPIKNRPLSLFVLDITEDPNNWQNFGYNVFFNKPDKKIKLKNNPLNSK